MICVDCGSDNLQFDSVSKMYYCPGCNSLFSEDEVNHTQEEESTDEDDEDYYEEEESMEEWVGEELNGLSLTVLNVLASIPIISLFVPLMISGSDVKHEYKKFFGYRLIAQILTFMSVLILYVVLYRSYEVSIQDICVKSLNLIAKAFTIQYNELSINHDIPTTISDDIFDSIIANHTVDEDGGDKFINENNLELFNGSTIDGTCVMNIIKNTNNYMCSYLVQTAGIRERHGKDVYRVVGWVVNNSYAEDNGTRGKVYFVKESDIYSLYTDDYGEYVYSSTSDLENSRYIFYVSPNEYYQLRLLYDDLDNIIGFAFKEID